MASVFYEELVAQKGQTPLTGLLLEYITATVATVEPEKRNEMLAQIVAAGLKDCGVTKSGNPKSNEVEDIVRKLVAYAERFEQQKVEDPSESQGAGKSFAGYLIQWASELNLAQLCLYLADYDYFLARRLYTELDQSLIVTTVNDKLKFEFERARTGLEACAFGFGGGYKGGAKEDENTEVIDLTKDNVGGEVLLKSMGF